MKDLGEASTRANASCTASSASAQITDQAEDLRHQPPVVGLVRLAHRVLGIHTLSPVDGGFGKAQRRGRPVAPYTCRPVGMSRVRRYGGASGRRPLRGGFRTASRASPVEHWWE